MIPVSTSPEPAVASQGEAPGMIEARPSGAATTVSGPLNSTVADLAGGVARALRQLGDRRAGAVLLPALAVKEPRELAAMRRQHHGRRAADRIARLSAAPDAKLVSASASSTAARRSALQGRAGLDQSAAVLADAETGPKSDDILALVLEQSGESGWPVGDAQHHRGQRGGVDGESLLRTSPE